MAKKDGQDRRRVRPRIPILAGGSGRDDKDRNHRPPSPQQRGGAHRLPRWEQAFRKAARTDNYRILRKHLSRLGLPGKPKLLLDGTVLAIRACLAYASFGGQPSGVPEILETQKYDPREARGVRYSLTFDLCGRSYARLLASPNIRPLDLADLNEFPWDRYKRCGYCRFWILRTDGRDLSPAEIARLERAVVEDLRFDYTEEELDIAFCQHDPVWAQQLEDNEDGYSEEEVAAWRDQVCPSGALLVNVYDLTGADDVGPRVLRAIRASLVNVYALTDHHESLAKKCNGKAPIGNVSVGKKSAKKR